MELRALGVACVPARWAHGHSQPDAAIIADAGVDAAPRCPDYNASNNLYWGDEADEPVPAADRDPPAQRQQRVLCRLECAGSDVCVRAHSSERDSAAGESAELR